MKLPFQLIWKNPEDHRSSAWNNRVLIIVTQFHDNDSKPIPLKKIKKMTIHIFKILKNC